MTDATSRPSAVHAFARRAIACGVSVIPIDGDGSKKSTLTKWGRYQHERASEDALRFWFARDPERGIAMVQGAVSGGLECLDFDDAEAYGEWRTLMERAGFEELLAKIECGYLEHSPRGVHLFYRCEQIDGGVKLAFRGQKARIETRGEGNYVICAPSAGSVHETGRPYTLVKGSVESIARINAEERAEMFAIARSLDEHPMVAPAPAALTRFERTPYEGVRPGDDFAQQHTWPEILEPHGWTPVYRRNDVTYWRRPGKTRGLSGTTGYGERGDFFYVFSTSTNLEARHAYNKFAAYAALSHDGNYRAAARELRARGFGSSGTSKSRPVRERLEDDLMENVPSQQPLSASGGTFDDLGFTLRDHVPPADCLFEHAYGQSLERGKVGLIAAEGGSGKTSITLQLAMAVGTGNDWLGAYRTKSAERVAAFFAEEDMRRLRERLGGTADLMDLSEGCMRQFGRNVYLWSGAERSCLMFETEGRTIRPTVFFREFCALVREWKPALLIIDPLAQFAPCAETDHESASVVMEHFKMLAAQLHCALYIVHHTRKPGAASREPTQHDARGSSAITNAAREQHALVKDEDGTGATFQCTKSNNGLWGPRSQIPLVFDEAYRYMPRPRLACELPRPADPDEAKRARETAQAEAHKSGIAKARVAIVAEVARLPGRSTSAVKSAVGGKRDWRDAAMAELKAEGAFDLVPGPRGAQLLWPLGGSPNARPQGGESV